MLQIMRTKTEATLKDKYFPAAFTQTQRGQKLNSGSALPVISVLH